jgi:heterotetrameric sarcosine oxidase gamma subunit
MVSLLSRCTIVRVQTWERGPQIPTHLEAALGIEWPASIGTAASGSVRVICVNPGDWLVLESGVDAGPLLHALSASFSGSAFRCTNLSSALSRLRAEGPSIRRVLANGCSVDFERDLFPPGHCVRTRFAAMPVIIHCVAPNVFELMVTTSYFEYLRAWLEDAALEYGDAA